MTSRSDLRAAAQQALEALECQRILTTRLDGKVKEVTPTQITDAIAAPRAALASPNPNPNPLGGPATRFRVVADRLEAGEDYAAVLEDMGLADVPAKPARAALAEPQTTHSTDCYKWHHGCAIAEVERLRGAKPAEPVAWSFEARHIDGPWVAAVSLKHPGPDGVYQRKVTPLYIAPTPRKPEPLTDEEIDRVTDQQWAQNNHKPVYAAHRAYAHAVIAAYESKQFGRGNE